MSTTNSPQPGFTKIPLFGKALGDCACCHSRWASINRWPSERFWVETPRPSTSVTWWLVCWMSWYRWGKQLPAIQKNKIKRLTSRRHVPCLQVYLQKKMPYPLVLQNLSQRKLTFPMPHISITFHYQNISKHPNLASKDSSHHPSVQVEGSLVLQHEIPSPTNPGSENGFMNLNYLSRFGDHTPQNASSDEARWLDP